VKRVVHVSSITAVGIAKKRRPVDESVEWNFDAINLEYAGQSILRDCCS